MPCILHSRFTNSGSDSIEHNSESLGTAWVIELSKGGNKIIESDTYLDDDLILRIIKFSAIDPITTMSIYADSM